ncbi:MAG: hypothetical protein U9P71_05250 [Campylobacterota bacterium]|nr:hypothetical protein [Campylobacterota bacterium]
MSLQIKWSYLFILFFSFFLLSGCGSDNSEAGSQAPGGVSGSSNISTLAVSGGDITASSNGEGVAIRIKAMSKDNVLVSTGNIIAQYLDNDSLSGELVPSVAPIIDGFATFNYTAPADIQAQIDAGNTGTSFRFFDQNNTKISTDVVITFDTSTQTDGDSDPISKLILSDTLIKVSASDDTKRITIRGLKSDNTLVKNGKVIIKYPNTGGVDVGTVPSEVEIIDGIGSFTYIAPSNLVTASTVSPVLFTVQDITNSSVSAQLTVSFLDATVSPTLSVNNGPITITKDAQSIKVNVLAVDSSGVPLKYGTIKLEYPSGTNIGHFAQSEALIENGIASFDYTGPDPLVSRSAVSFTFVFKENSVRKTTWNVSFSPDTPAVPDPDPIISSILLSEAAFTVTNSQETRNVFVYAFNSDGVGVSEGEVEIKYPNTAVTAGVDAGSTPATVTITDGIGSFTYTAPSDISNAVTISPATFRVQSSANSSVYKNFAVTYAPTSGTSINPTINIQGANPLSINTDAQEVDITLLVVDSNNNNRPLSEGTILVEYPAQGNVGTFAQSEVTISNGQVVFSYKAPNNLADLIDSGVDNANFTFVYKENQINPEVLNIKFDPDAPVSEDTNIYNLKYFGPQTIIISENSQSVPIDIYGFDVNNAPVQTGTVRVKYPNENTQTNIGNVSPSSEGTIESGKVTFTYTGPSDLNKTMTDLNETKSVIYSFCDATPDTDTCADVNLTFELDTTTPQPDLQEYEIDFGVGTDNTLNLESLTSFTVVLKTEAGETVDASRIKDINITTKRPTLAEVKDINGTVHSPMYEFGANKNPVNAYIQTYKISGLVDFEISIGFNDTAGDYKVETEIKSVVIFSGPPTTLSITKNGSSKDANAGAFKDELVVHVTDQYNNPVNTKPEFTVSAVIGPTNDPAHAKDEHDGGGEGDFGFLYNLNGVGSISSSGSGASFTTTGNHDFSEIDINNDKLITFTPTDNEYKYPALGVWTITAVNIATKTLTLEEDYAGDVDPAQNLRYVIGHNFRDSSCASTIGHYNVRVAPEGDRFQLDENGTGKVNLFYDYPLVGADVFVAANILGYSNASGEVVRIGNAYKRYLTGVGIKEVQEISYTAVGSVYWGHGSIAVHIEETGYNMQYGYASPQAKVGSRGYISFNTFLGYIDGNTSNTSGSNLMYSNDTSFNSDVVDYSNAYFLHDGINDSSNPRYIDNDVTNKAQSNLEFTQTNKKDHQYTGCDNSAEYDVYITAKEGEEVTVTTYVPNLFSSELN